MWETLLAITVIATLAMMSPGPDFFLVVKNAARYPRAAAMATVAGVNVGILVHMSYCIAGLALVIATTPWLFNLLKYAGAAYLIWIGIQALRSRGGPGLASVGTAPREQIGLRAAFMQGFLCNLLNPKATLFFFSVFTQLSRPDTGLGEKALIGFVIFALGVVYWPLLVLAIQHPAVIRVMSRLQRGIDRVLGGVLVALGIKVALS